MGKCVAVVSQKGGVGKTTLTANLAVAFGALRFRTLLVEGDPQGSLVTLFGLDRFDLHRGLFGCLSEGLGARECLEPEIAPQVDLLPANVWSHEEEREYVGLLERDPLGLRALLAGMREEYDYILIDCPPSLGPLTKAGLAAADGYLVPVQAEALNLATLPRLRALADTVRSLHNPGLFLEGFVITMADTRTRHTQEVIGELAAVYPRELLQTVIPRSIRVAEEGRRGRPTVLSRPSSPAGQAFQRLAEEILSRDARERVGADDGSPEGEDPVDTGRLGVTPEEEAAVRLLLREAAVQAARGANSDGEEHGS